MRASVDVGRCEGHGRCYELAAELFAEDEFGHATAIIAEVPPDLEAKARAAMNACPEQAISVSD
jgi:ferredoxin